MREFITFGIPMCIAISVSFMTVFGFICFALIDDAGTVRSTWDWFAVASGVLLICAVFVIASLSGKLAALDYIAQR